MCIFDRNARDLRAIKLMLKLKFTKFSHYTDSDLFIGIRQYDLNCNG